MPLSCERPIVTLTTDFGPSDHYVGTLKGVILSRCGAAVLIDISHQIPAFSIVAGAYAISQAAPYFPPGTVHLVVVDPGVGTNRKPILLEAANQYFIAPDNGVLSLIYQDNESAKIREITNRSLWAANPSSTFHGRDIFAPVAAALAAGDVNASDVGPLLPRMEMLPGLKPNWLDSRVCEGMVLSVDHFGNLISNVPAADVPQLTTEDFEIAINGLSIRNFLRTFADAPPGLCFAYFGSSGMVEIGMNQASAAAWLTASPGDALAIRLK